MPACAQRRPDRTETDDERMTAAATAVLQRRLDGMPHRSAVALVGANQALSRAEVHRSWRAKRCDALIELTVGRVVDACPWTDVELRALARIFADARWPAESGEAAESAAPR
jgi:hypothetical protein